MNYTVALPDSSPIIPPAILGLQPWAFLLIVFIAFIAIIYVGTIVLDSRKRTQNLKKTVMPDGKTRKVNAVFITEGQQAYERICEVWMNEAEVKDKGSKVKTIGQLTAPAVASQRIPKYYLVSKYMYQIRWPKNAKASQQTEIMQVFYRENFSFPGFSFEELSKDERVAMTAILTSISADQNVANAVVTEIQQKFDAFTKAINKLKGLQLILYVAGAGAIIGLFNLIISFRGYSVVSIIRKFFGIP